ncbi:MAG: hypothetical protein NT007_00510 [Candidatus Kapabacteria bacterium]|nr:hypothetical protein [Candidatus Kapabacteria bacterium]
MLKFYDEICSRIMKKDDILAQIFNELAAALSEEINSDHGGFDNQHQIDQSAKNLPKLANEISNRILNGDKINIYPGGFPGKCHSVCVCKAFGKWNSYKYGFKGTAKYLVEEYFVNCLKINQSILILTFAWDELDFIEKFKDKFENYIKQGKIICVVLVTINGFSIQYLR